VLTPAAKIVSTPHPLVFFPQAVIFANIETHPLLFFGVPFPP
jgi:hypothetical protein